MEKQAKRKRFKPYILIEGDNILVDMACYDCGKKYNQCAKSYYNYCYLKTRREHKCDKCLGMPKKRRVF